MLNAIICSEIETHEIKLDQFLFIKLISDGPLNEEKIEFDDNFL